MALHQKGPIANWKVRFALPALICTKGSDSLTVRSSHNQLTKAMDGLRYLDLELINSK